MLPREPQILRMNKPFRLTKPKNRCSPVSSKPQSEDERNFDARFASSSEREDSESLPDYRASISNQHSNIPSRGEETSPNRALTSAASAQNGVIPPPLHITSMPPCSMLSESPTQSGSSFPSNRNRRPWITMSPFSTRTMRSWNGMDINNMNITSDDQSVCESIEVVNKENSMFDGADTTRTKLFSEEMDIVAFEEWPIVRKRRKHSVCTNSIFSVETVATKIGRSPIKVSFASEENENSQTETLSSPNFKPHGQRDNEIRYSSSIITLSPRSILERVPTGHLHNSNDTFFQIANFENERKAEGTAKVDKDHVVYPYPTDYSPKSCNKSRLNSESVFDNIECALLSICSTPNYPTRHI